MDVGPVAGAERALDHGGLARAEEAGELRARGGLVFREEAGEEGFVAVLELALDDAAEEEARELDVGGGNEEAVVMSAAAGGEDLVAREHRALGELVVDADVEADAGEDAALRMAHQDDVVGLL